MCPFCQKNKKKIRNGKKNEFQLVLSARSDNKKEESYKDAIRPCSQKITGKDLGYPFPFFLSAILALKKIQDKRNGLLFHTDDRQQRKCAIPLVCNLVSTSTGSFKKRTTPTRRITYKR